MKTTVIREDESSRHEDVHEDCTASVVEDEVWVSSLETDIIVKMYDVGTWDKVVIER